METLSKFENNEQIPVVEFVYDREKDIDCLLEKGPSGYFSPYPTKTYKDLVARTGDNPTREQTADFIEQYIQEKGIVIPSLIEECKKESGELLSRFRVSAEKFFGIKIPENTQAYLTVNNRCPYNIEQNYFYTTISSIPKVIAISLHELWHFYTWYKFGIREKEQKEITMQRYGDIKEALTILLNPECLNLLPEGERDNGYPQHEQLRKKIIALWNQNPDAEFIWNSIREE